MKKINIQLPENVRTIITALQSHGHEAYAVGGCVRDSILGRVPGDWDITTSAMPEETKEIFDRTFDTGIEHGTITVLMGKEGYEVTTYRIDGEYEDSRHPKEVVFTRNLKEDLLRRDFTINAMAYNETDGVVDIFGGMEDLKAGIIRCVGNARDRFSEDALRILRGVRFAAQLGFEIEEETKAGMRELAPTLKNISAERIQTELIKMLVSPRPDMLREAYQLGITKQFLPEFDRMMETEQENPHHIYNVGEHTLHAMCNVEADKVLRFTMLLHDVGKIESKEMDEDGVAHFYMHVTKGQEMAKKILERCAKNEIVLEVEAGVVGGEEDGVNTEDAPSEKLYTTPEDMMLVYDTLGQVENGYFTLAATFGNVHGVYKPGNVKLNPKILKEGQDALKAKHGDDAHYLLVFHGGSGSPKEDIEETLQYGVIKMNVDTDTQYAFSRPIADHFFKNYDGVLKVDGEVGVKKVYDPRSYLKKAEQGITARVVEACNDLHSAGKSIY